MQVQFKAWLRSKLHIKLVDLIIITVAD